MLTKTPELRVRSIKGTTFPPRKKNSPALWPTDPMDHIIGREHVTLEVNDNYHDKTFYPYQIETNHHCIALEQLSGRRPATSVLYTYIDSFFVPGPTSQPFAGWSEVNLVWRTVWQPERKERRPPYLLLDGVSESNLSISVDLLL
ncbi:uncharacterized protein HKW66_Vig0248490 [Vigna angularis]|uniref:Uncharacterized protein n=1 Tax=Phaseolus angularis TaxID=3914 RepID=A0A8T0JUU0_PHAAN|nr:uncharacterized protein HKW66_Vig0248490 [Vigna angularis]